MRSPGSTGYTCDRCRERGVGTLKAMPVDWARIVFEQPDTPQPQHTDLCAACAEAFLAWRRWGTE